MTQLPRPPNAGRFNGPSGAWVEANVIGPLGSSRAGAWITDCLDTYCASVNIAERIEDTYSRFADEHSLPTAMLAAHPDENAVVAQAFRGHDVRLRREIGIARPDVFVTLGNAAMRVLRTLVEPGAGIALPTRLKADKAYGQSIAVRVGGRDATWWPLAHPAAPVSYQDAHREWLLRCPRATPTVAARPR